MSWVVLDRFCLIVVIIKTGEYSWMGLTIHGNMVCCVVHQFDLCYTIILKLFLLNTFRVLYDRIYRVSRQYFPLSHVSPKLFCIWLTTSFSPPAMHMHLLKWHPNATATIRLFGWNLFPNWFGEMRILYTGQMFKNIRKKIGSSKFPCQYSEKASNMHRQNQLRSQLLC